MEKSPTISRLMAWDPLYHEQGTFVPIGVYRPGVFGQPIPNRPSLTTQLCPLQGHWLSQTTLPPSRSTDLGEACQRAQQNTWASARRQTIPHNGNGDLEGPKPLEHLNDQWSHVIPNNVDPLITSWGKAPNYHDQPPPTTNVIVDWCSLVRACAIFMLMTTPF